MANSTITKKLEAQAAQAAGGDKQATPDLPKAKPAGRKRKSTASEGEGGVAKAPKRGVKKSAEPVEEESDEIEEI